MIDAQFAVIVAHFREEALDEAVLDLSRAHLDAERELAALRRELNA